MMTVDAESEAFTKALNDFAEIVRKFIPERRNIIKKLEYLCYNISIKHYGLNIGKLSGSSLSLVGGAIVIAGLAVAAPPLAVAGAVVGGVAAAAGLAAVGTDAVVHYRSEKEAYNLLQEHKTTCAELDCKREEVFKTLKSLKAKNINADKEWLKYQSESLSWSQPEKNDQKWMTTNATANIALNVAKSVIATADDGVATGLTAARSAIPVVLGHVAAGLGLFFDLFNIIYIITIMIKRKNRSAFAIKMQTEVLPDLLADLKKFEQFEQCITATTDTS